MVRIGHASIDERGKVSGGTAGDGTGKEVCTRNFYVHKKGWNVLRAKDPDIAEKIAKCMEDVCANPCIGYDQSQRLSLYDTVKALNFYCDIDSLKVKVECDCSSLVRVCLAYAGVMVRNFTTGNEKSVIMATGKFDCLECEADGSNLKRGDILVTKTKGHTVVVLSNGAVVKTGGFDVGDVVMFTGDTHYTGANKKSGKACKSGKAKVTDVKEGAKHPYHLKRVSGGGSTVYGWVDEADVKAFTTASTYYPKYTGTSSNLDTILKEIGVPSEYIKDKTSDTWRVRIPLAQAQGIDDYTGSGTQNAKLKSLAKNGLLKRV